MPSAQPREGSDGTPSRFAAGASAQICGGGCLQKKNSAPKRALFFVFPLFHLKKKPTPHAKQGRRGHSALNKPLRGSHFCGGLPPYHFSYSTHAAQIQALRFLRDSTIFGILFLRDQPYNRVAASFIVRWKGVRRMDWYQGIHLALEFVSVMISLLSFLYSIYSNQKR